MFAILVFPLQERYTSVYLTTNRLSLFAYYQMIYEQHLLDSIKLGAID